MAKTLECAWCCKEMPISRPVVIHHDKTFCSTECKDEFERNDYDDSDSVDHGDDGDRYYY